MTGTESTRRARRVWAAAVALAVVAVAVPVVALAVHDAPSTDGRGRLAAATTETASAPTAPSAAGTPEPSPGDANRTPVRALFFGDSYFIGGGYTDESNSMARIAADKLGWQSEINGGGGTGFVQTNYEYDLGNYLDQIAQGAFDVGPRRWVVIEGGNNDVGLPLADVRRNARKVVRIAQRSFPRARVVLVGPLGTDSDHTELMPIIKTLRGVAAKRGVPFVNMKSWLAGNYDLIGPDYVHPYPKGHRILGRKLARALRGVA